MAIDDLLPDPAVMETAAGRHDITEVARTLLDRLAVLRAAVNSDIPPSSTGIAWKRLSRTSRRLHEAVEALDAIERPILEVSSRLGALHPDAPVESWTQAASALLVCREWDARDRSDPAFRLHGPLAAHLVHGATAGSIQLAFFVCPPVDFRRLTEVCPEDYLLGHFHGSVLSGLVERLRQLFADLDGAGVRFQAHAILADTDETDYLWRGIGHPTGLKAEHLEQRWAELATTLGDYLGEDVPCGRASRPRVVRPDWLQVSRLSELVHPGHAGRLRAAVAADPTAFFESADLDAEHLVMKRLWRPGGYYDGMQCPAPERMAAMIVDKFAAYARQGVLLHQLDPSLVLVQTERPALLRERMLSVGWRHRAGRPPAVLQYFPAETAVGARPATEAREGGSR